MMNPKRGLAETISCVAMEDPGCLATSLKIWSKRKTPVENPEGQATDKKPRLYE